MPARYLLSDFIEDFLLNEYVLEQASLLAIPSSPLLYYQAPSSPILPPLHIDQSAVRALRTPFLPLSPTTFITSPSKWAAARAHFAAHPKASAAAVGRASNITSR
ncbi:hypothetical protein MBM_07769 [Drepanopeziza brunnea f. sp. 'multigermtubi' MB_m1]|uniref:Uncharacterized protein n=1 Tax=Marssonina brunnea f. sp. multigermtubi (strain MB_m1) TaxID=1072389 RepID=K1WP36_MARBU|nr:uncharacterized protein MBM_07769 [Drepanopeziza brunnea f. sp. 'multigermtubi' MB_m1]EKD14092.1 hypothetical protein MBM_07769 [Drepanopeziza brunnea f. sp. 'multigermtubi' MB_m1]